MNKLTLNEKWVIGILTLLAAAAAGLVIAKTGVLGLVIIPVLFFVVLAIFKIFRDPLWGFSAIVFFLPFERVPTYDLGGVNIKINTILGFIVLLAWVLALMFNGKKWKLTASALTVPLGLFCMAILLSLTQAINLERGYVVTAFVLFTIALSVLATNMVQTKEDLVKVIGVLFASSLFVGLFGLFQFAGDVVGLPNSITLLKQGYDSRVFGFPRIQAFSMEPLYFADYLLIPISLGLAYYFGKTKEFVSKWLILGLTVLLLVNFVLTVSRGAYLGFVGAFLVLSVLMFKKIFTWKHVLIAVVSVAVVGYGVAFALSKGDTRATNEFINHVFLKDYTVGESVQGRLNAFDLAYQAYQHNPALGIGLGNYGPFTKGYPVSTPTHGWDIVNNEYLEILAETGFIGFSAFMLIILTLIIRSLVAIKKAKDEFLRLTMIGLLASFVGVCIQYMSFSTLYIIHIWVLMGLMVGVQNLILNSKKVEGL
ncbi:MAG: O-antigen ligase family protein [Candidatus Berkelbacteria bacterium]